MSQITPTPYSSLTMTQDDPGFADTYKSLVEAEKQALALEAMLDRIDGKLDSLLGEINATPSEEVQTEVKLNEGSNSEK